MQTSTPPDVDALIHGGRVRRRRRNMTRIGLTAAIVVLAGGAAYGVSQIDPGGPRSDPGTREPADRAVRVRAEPAGPPDGAPAPNRSSRARTGCLVGYDSTGAAIEADLTVAGHGLARAGDFPVVSRTTGPSAGFGVYRPTVAGRRVRLLPTTVHGNRQRGRDDAVARRTARPDSRAARSSSHAAPTEAFDHDAHPPTAADRRASARSTRCTACRRHHGVARHQLQRRSPRRSSSTSGSWT